MGELLGPLAFQEDVVGGWVWNDLQLSVCLGSTDDVPGEGESKVHKMKYQFPQESSKDIDRNPINR